MSDAARPVAQIRDSGAAGASSPTTGATGASSPTPGSTGASGPAHGTPRSQELLEMAGVDGAPLRLEELCDRRALGDMIVSCEGLFGVPILILSATGGTLAGAPVRAPLWAVIGEREGGRRAYDAVLDGVKRFDLSAGAGVQAAFAGAVYHVVPITYDRTLIGRILVGPYVAAEGADGVAAPAALAAIDPGLDPARLEAAWAKTPRITRGRAEEIGKHLATVLDVILFSGHKALLTSQMHLASIRESYRELCEKNERLEEAYQRLKELDRLKSNFLATVSHELRTPLTSIMGYGEMLAVGVAGPLSPEQADFVETIRTKSEQLLSLIMSLLDLSKLESGTTTVRIVRMPIRKVIDEAVSTLMPTALKKSVKLVTDIPADLPLILGDGERLRQVFINLTDNAVKFTPEEGTVSIIARAVAEEADDEEGLVLVAPTRQTVQVRVVDTGIGIPEIERAKVFDPFYQVDQTSTREYGGAGLGLAIVKRLVEAHQGTIHVEGNEPHGAVFVVSLPAARPGSVRPAAMG